MKPRKLYPPALSILLIVSYVGLLVAIAIIRFAEYRQTRDAGKRINEIAKVTSHKLELLAATGKTHDSVQRFRRVDARQIRQAIASTEGNLSSYRKLIRSSSEQLKFDELEMLNREINSLYASLVFLKNAQSNGRQRDILYFISRKNDLLDSFHVTGRQLSELVGEQSEFEIKDISQNIVRLARKKEISSFLVIALLLLLGLNIGFILKRLGRTENKYRLLFDMGPIPTYFIDSTSFRILEVNQAAIHKYGYSEQEFLQMSFFDLCHTNELESISRPGEVLESLAKHSKKNGEVLDVQVNARPIYLVNKKVFLVTANDITGKEKLERELVRSTITAQEKERRELAAELHDNICQIMASSKLYLEMAKEKDAVSKDRYIQEARKYINLALSETRRLSHRMAPAHIEEASLVEIIDNLLVEMNADNSLGIEFRYDGKILWHKAPTDLKLNLYRICQEQLTNIRKYAYATTVIVELELKHPLFRMTICDNGVGFDINKGKGGIGLHNMKKRAESFSGTLVVDSSPGNGCVIHVEIPITTICEC